MMDLFHHRYYKLSKTLLVVIGLWPFQSTRAKWGFRAVYCAVTVGLGIPQFLAIVKYRSDSKSLLECLPGTVFGIICGTKMGTALRHAQKVGYNFANYSDPVVRARG